MQAEALIHWPDPIRELSGFVASFLATGAIGFRYAVVRDRASAEDLNPSPHAPIYADAAHRAAIIGVIGTLISAVLLFLRLPQQASRRHTGVLELISSNGMIASQVILLGLAVVGFLLVISGRRSGWIIAAIGVIAGPLRGIVNGEFARLLNPVHVMAGGFWIGTLFVLLVAGIWTILRANYSGDERATIAAEMVNSFSPLALTAAGTLALFGVIIALRHLDPFSSLWTTPYGYALIVKLCVVAIVVSLGAWNWRRQKARMSTEAGLHSIKRSARAELIAAGVVLCITAILVSLPSPKESLKSAAKQSTPSQPSTQ